MLLLVGLAIAAGIAVMIARFYHPRALIPLGLLS